MPTPVAFSRLAAFALLAALAAGCESPRQILFLGANASHHQDLTVRSVVLHDSSRVTFDEGGGRYEKWGGKAFVTGKRLNATDSVALPIERIALVSAEENMGLPTWLRVCLIIGFMMVISLLWSFR